MREVDAHPQGMMLAQHLHQVARDAHRQNGRDLCTNPYKLDVLHLPQAGQKPIELVVADRERVAARQYDFLDGGITGDHRQRPLHTLDQSWRLASDINAVIAVGYE